MERFIEGEDRSLSTLFPEHLDDHIAEDNPVRVIDLFVDELDLSGLGFDGAKPEVTGRPSYHPASLLKIYIYGYVNRIQSSRRLERETQRNVELIWLTGRFVLPFIYVTAGCRSGFRLASRKPVRQPQQSLRSPHPWRGRMFIVFLWTSTPRRFKAPPDGSRCGVGVLRTGCASCSDAPLVPVAFRSSAGIPQLRHAAQARGASAESMPSACANNFKGPRYGQHERPLPFSGLRAPGVRSCAGRRP